MNVYPGQVSVCRCKAVVCVSESALSPAWLFVNVNSAKQLYSK